MIYLLNFFYQDTCYIFVFIYNATIDMKKGTRYQFDFVTTEFKDNFQKLAIDNKMSIQAMIEQALIAAYPQVFNVTKEDADVIRATLNIK